MAEFIKCPRCELNYILKHERVCKVCRPKLYGCLEKDPAFDHEAQLDEYWEAQKAKKESYEAFRAIRYNVPQRRNV